MPILRSLRRSPGFAVTSILILGLGIGLATAVFSVAHTMLIRPLPVRDQDRIIALWGENQARTFLNFPLQIRHAREFARQTRTLETTAFFAYEGSWISPVRDGDRLIPLALAYVSGNYFSMLGARPLVGRALQLEDDVVGADPVVVLSHAAWQRDFGGDASVLGRRVELHVTGMRYRVVGVMPPGLDYPRGADLWSPIVPAFAKRGALEDGDVALIGRLRPGVSPSAVRDELSVFFRREPYSRWGGTVTAVATSFSRLVTGEVRPAVLIFSFATALLLLITCINVANLVLVRGLSRGRELTVRAALGAQRSRLVLHLLGENAVLALAGGGLGVLVARGAVEAFGAFAPVGLPRVGPIGIDGTALAAALAIALGALLLFGLLPAVASSRVDLLATLRSGLRQGGSRGGRRVAEGLVTAQVVLAVVVLAAAGLLGRSLLKLEHAELSFEPSRLLIGDLTIRIDALEGRARQVALLDQITEAVRAVHGVVAVSPVNAVPFSGSGGWDGRPSVVGQSEQDSQGNPMLNMEIVTPDYFRVFEMPVLRGRGFSDADREGAPKVIMLSESAARYFWPQGDAIGKRMFMVGNDTASVIGIVRDTRYRELKTARASIYYPFAQSPFPFAPTSLSIRTALPATELIPQLTRALGAVDPSVAVVRLAPFGRYLEAQLAQPRFNALLLGVFAVGAVALAAVGLFGVMAQMVKQRSRELGVRMALGATATNVRAIVLWRGLTIAGVGVGVGIAGALLANRMLRAMLYGVGPSDGVTLLLVGGLILAVAAVATGIPARAGSRLDPAATLRVEE
ncbi:MAG: FtsX-like permease family protein [Gemmatimonadales bacterium]|nr:FtsX-like permease family protein [Gemmatimonadales bacterium]